MFIASFKANQDVPHPTVHRLEQREGVTHTALISKRVLFKKMKKDPFRPHIISELAARGITPSQGEMRDYQKLLKRLKDDEGDSKSFCPRTPFENFKWW